MESYSCNLALSGNIGMIVRKEGLSVAQLIVLRHIHGDSSVIDIEENGKMDASGSDRQRLVDIYGEQKVAEVFGPYGDLPTKIEESKIPESYFAKPVNKGGRPKKKAPAKKAPAKTEVKEEPASAEE
tara:strand:+ start:17437 stop:17817 length:381 start_codon:yes stop_codon:yes gene_type:complete